MMDVIDTLSLPFLALCLVIYTTVMGWLVFKRDKLPSRLEDAGKRGPPPSRRRDKSAALVRNRRGLSG